MEAYDHHNPCESSSFCKDEEKVEAVGDLLEQCWFFHNLLDRKPRIARCFSDPCPSSFSSSSSIADQVASTTTEKEQLPRSNLLRTPSLPPNLGRELEGSKEKHRNSRRSKLTRQSSHKLALQTTTPEPPCLEKKGGEKGRESDSRKSKTTTGHHSLQRNLQRTPSLPPNIGRTEFMYHHQDEEIDPSSIAKSSHQTSPNLRPPHKAIPRCKPPRNTEMVESIIDTDGCKEMRRRYLSEGKISMRKSLNDLEIEEVQGFKDLGFTFENKDLSPSVVNIIPGLQDKDKKGINEDLKLEKVRRPYLSEAWMLQSCAPQFPNWDDIARRRSSEDIKTQIMFWARSVASNVR